MLDFGFHGRQSVLDEEDVFEYEAHQREKEARQDQIGNDLLPDYGDDYDNYAQKSRRKLSSLVMQETNNTLNSSETRLHIDQLNRREEKDNDPQPQPEPQKAAVRHHLQGTSKHQMHLQQNQTKQEGPVKKVEQIKPKGRRPPRRQKVKSVETTVRLGETNPQSIPVDREQLEGKEQQVVPSENLNSEQHQIQKSRKMNHTQVQRLNNSKLQPLERDNTLPEKPTVAMQQSFVTRHLPEIQPIAKKHFTTQKRDTTHSRLKQKHTYNRKRLRDKAVEIGMPLQHDLENNIHKGKVMARDKMGKKYSDTKVDENQVYNRAENRRDTREGKRDSLWGPGGHFEGADDEDLTPAPVFDTEVNWSQTFQVKALDLQTLRSDWIDLRCNVSGNLLLHSSDVLPVVKAFMDQLNEKHSGYVVYSIYVLVPVHHLNHERHLCQ